MAKSHAHRVQTLLTDKQYDTLARLANEQDKTLSALVRDAVEQMYCIAAEREQRRAALAGLLALDAPVSDWPQMEEEITHGYRE